MTTNEKPQIDIPADREPPTQLEVEDIVVGDGEEAVPGRQVDVHYVGVAWSSGEQFDASWDRGGTFSFGLGEGRVIKGWDQGVAGMKVGGKRTLVIPPELGYGAAGAGSKIPGNSTLVFDIEMIGLARPGQ